MELALALLLFGILIGIGLRDVWRGRDDAPRLKP